MKKTILSIMLVALMCMATACSTATDNQVDIVTMEENTEGASVFGKVKSVVGNEIELEIAEPPFGFDAASDVSSDDAQIETKEFIYEFNTDEELPEGLEGLDSSGNETSGVVGDSSGVIIAITGEDGDVQVIGGEGGEKMDLTYTGESKSVIIPAGTEIMNLIGSGTLEDIKKGSVLMITVDDETASSLKALNVIIME